MPKHCPFIPNGTWSHNKTRPCCVPFLYLKFTSQRIEKETSLKVSLRVKYFRSVASNSNLSTDVFSFNCDLYLFLVLTLRGRNILVTNSRIMRTLLNLYITLSSLCGQNTEAAEAAVGYVAQWSSLFQLPSFFGLSKLLGTLWLFPLLNL